MWDDNENNLTGSNGPRVSIGLPVYNGEEYLAGAIGSILGQTYRDFELILCDNASTDGTEAICRSFARQDRRVRYERQERNVGAAENFNRAAQLARGEYFRWAAHDDVCGPEHLERCVAALDAHPGAVLAQGEAAIIDRHGQVIATPEGQGRVELLDPAREMDSSDPVRRFYELLLRTKWCFEIFGLMRRSALRRTRGHGLFYGGDKVLLSSLCLMGPFVAVPEVLFYRRHHLANSTSLQESAQRQAWIGGSRKKQKSARMQCLCGYARAVWEAELPVGAKLRCMGVLVKYVGQFHKWRRKHRSASTPTGGAHIKTSEVQQLDLN